MNATHACTHAQTHTEYVPWIRVIKEYLIHTILCCCMRTNCRMRMCINTEYWKNGNHLVLRGFLREKEKGRERKRERERERVSYLVSEFPDYWWYNRPCMKGINDYLVIPACTNASHTHTLTSLSSSVGSGFSTIATSVASNKRPDKIKTNFHTNSIGNLFNRAKSTVWTSLL